MSTKTYTILSVKDRMVFWTGAFILFVLVFWMLKGVLLPFVLGIAIAYLLDPVMEFLSRKGLPRPLAAMTLLGLFFALIIGLLSIITPLAYKEALQLAEDMPGYIEHLWTMLEPHIVWMQEKFGGNDIAALQEAFKNNIGKALKISGDIVSSLASGGQALAGFMTTLVITPIVAYFMMKEWQPMTRWMDEQIPRDHYDTVKKLLKDIDGKISGFVRGQITVAVFLGLIYAGALTIAGLKFGFLIGLGAGLLSIIPMVGSTLGLLVSVAVAWFQSGELSYVGIIAVIFFVGQFVEGNILTPRLLGKSVGLHPLWILFALLVGGSLFGIVGMLLAVPVLASIGVLAGFALERYRESPYYKPNEPPKTETKPKQAKKKTQKKKS